MGKVVVRGFTKEQLYSTASYKKTDLTGIIIANNNLNDPYANAVLYGIAPGRAYVDNEQCYSCNEVTIYWNSPLIYLLTGLN